MRVVLLGVMGLMGALGLARAADLRLQTVDYSADQIYLVHGVPGYALDVQLADDETLEGMGGGDLEAVSVLAHGSHVFLKPKALHVATNLTVLTNRHVYQFTYRVESGRSTEPILYALRFRYPEEIARAAAAERESARLQAALSAPRPIVNRAYGFCGARSLKPVTATDDGVETRLGFPERSELPAVYLRNEDGTESLVNFSVVPEGLLIHRVARAFVLRRGHLVACIQNLAYTGGSAAASTSTVTPAVTREALGAQP